jgi:hypothetical protein
VTLTDEALERCFVSPNVPDNNLEPVNLVDVMDRLGRALAVGLDRVADGLQAVAKAITDHGKRGA